MSKPSFGSLFSGIGGMDLGLQKAGWYLSWQCEIDPLRRDVLYQKFRKPIMHDVRHSAALGRVHLIAGGFPCQDVSIAGPRTGLSGERSSLFHEFMRIVVVNSPMFVLIENVPGLFTSNDGRDFKTVIDTLVSFGYGVGWRVFNSRYFGVPQHRRRVFILGTLIGHDTSDRAVHSAEILGVGADCRRHPATGRATRPNAAAVSISGLGGGGADDNDAQAGRIVPTVTSKWAKGTGGPAGDELQNIIDARRLTPVECERLQGLPDDWTAGMEYDTHRYRAIGDAVTVPVAEFIGRRIRSV